MNWGLDLPGFEPGRSEHEFSALPTELIDMSTNTFFVSYYIGLRVEPIQITSKINLGKARKTTRSNLQERIKQNSLKSILAKLGKYFSATQNTKTAFFNYPTVDNWPPAANQ